MTISWNQWLDAAALTPKAGQIQSTQDEEVIRAKRPWGTSLLSTERLDRNRSPEQVQANRQSLADLRASLAQAFGGPVAQAVYDQLFTGREANGRPISARDIRLADGLAAQLKGAHDWLVGQKERFDPDIAVRAFSQVMNQPLAIRRDRLPVAELTDRVGRAKDLAVELQTERGIALSRDRFLELFAATPATARGASGELLLPREILRRQLMEMIDAPEQPAPVAPGAQPAPASEAVDLAQRKALLRSLLPSNDQLLSMERIEERASEIEVMHAQFQAARSAHLEVLQALSDAQAKLPSEKALGDARTALSTAQAALSVAMGQQADSRQALDAAIEALSRVQGGAEALTMTQDELQLLEQEAETLAADELAHQAHWVTVIEPLATEQMNARFKLDGIKGVHFLDKRAQKALVRAAEQRATEAKLAHQEQGKRLAERTQKLEARRQSLVARLKEQRAAQALAQTQDDAGVDPQVLLAQRRSEVKLAQAAWQQAGEALDACQLAHDQARQALAPLEQAQAAGSAEIADLESLAQTRKEARDHAEQGLRQVQARNDPALGWVTDTLVSLRALDRGRSQPGDFNLQELEAIDWMLQLKLQATPEGSVERPPLQTLAVRVRDELLGQLSETFIELPADPALGYEVVVPDDRYKDYAPYLRHFQGGTSNTGARHPSPELLVAFGLSQIRHYFAEPDEAARKALFRSSEDDRFAMLALLEQRQREVQAGTLEPAAFDKSCQDLLQALRNQIGLGPVLQKHVIAHGASLDGIVALYHKAKRLVEHYEQDIALEQAAVREGRQAQLDRSRSLPLVSALRAALQNFLHPDPAGRADPQGEALAQQIARAVENVQTNQEKLADARQLRDFSALILQAVDRPSNDAALMSMIRIHYFSRFNAFPEPQHFATYLAAMRDLVPEELRAA